MLSDQIHNQTDKIVELEKTLDSKKTDLKNTENMLQIEMMNRSSLETTKLELLSEVSGLKLRQVRTREGCRLLQGIFQTTTEKENEELRRQLQRTLQLAGGSYDGFRWLPPP